MKGKINRKIVIQPFPPSNNRMSDTQQLKRFKFQISNDNISCFIGKTKTSKRVCRKTSQSSVKSQKFSSKPKASLPKKNTTNELKIAERKK